VGVLRCRVPLLSTLIAILATGQSQADLRGLIDQAAADLSAGDFTKAIAPLEKAHKLAPADAGISFNLGLAYIKTGNYASAVKMLQPAVAKPDLADQARFLLGTAYFELNSFQQAGAELEPLRSHPKYAADALYLLEESYRKSGRLQEAEQAFADLVQRFPDSGLVHKLLGTAHDAQGQPREALTEFEKAARSDPSLPEVRFDAGLMCLKVHDESAAHKWFNEELAVNPCSAPALYYLGEIERTGGQSETAAGFYRKAIACAPSYGDAYLGLGIALQSQDKDSEALRALRRAVELRPEKSEAHFQLARALAKAGLKDESRQELQKARELASASPEAGRR
jgi:tetratricopeptide (TPR) repeat protein